MPILDSVRAWVSLPRLLNTVIAELRKVATLMADTSPLLNELAENLRAFAAGPLAALIARNAELEAANAALVGEDVAETAAAQNAVDAFNALTLPVTESPDVPVEIPPVDVPETPVP